jgi:hypothetical protein
MESISKLSEKVEGMVNMVVNGFCSQYFSFTWNDELWTVRVSDHKANPLRVSENTISFVVEPSESDSEEYSNWGRNKKTFRSISNQFFLDSDGDFTENFRDMEECLDYILN